MNNRVINTKIITLSFSVNIISLPTTKWRSHFIRYNTYINYTQIGRLHTTNTGKCIKVILCLYCLLYLSTSHEK